MRALLIILLASISFTSCAQRDITYKKLDVTFVILCNGNNYTQNDITIAMASAFYGKDFEIPDMEVKKGIDVPLTTLQFYEGTYQTNDMPLNIQIFVKDDQLQAQATGQGAFPLSATSDTEFVFEAARIKLQFVKTENGYTEMNFTQGEAKFIFKKKQ